jgi:hypothetical protein
MVANGWNASAPRQRGLDGAEHRSQQWTIGDVPPRWRQLTEWDRWGVRDPRAGERSSPRMVIGW